ncbi:MAG: efflux RND transporter periplasmic adaptor subunit, partial [Bacillota bacterium]
YSGRVKLKKSIRLAPEINGTVKNLKVEIGQRVKTGEKLVELDQEKINLAIERSKLAVEQANVGLDQSELNLEDLKEERKIAELNVDKSKANLTEIKAKLSEAKANLQKIKKNYQRSKRLYQEGAIHEKEYEAAKTNYQMAVAKVEQIEAQQQGIQIEMKKLKTKLEQLTIKERMLQENLKKAQLNLESAENNLQQQNLDLANTVLRAPERGIIVDKKAETGEVVGRGQPLLELGVDNKVKVDVAVANQDLNLIKEDTKAQLTFVGLEDQTYTTEVNKIYPLTNRSGLTTIELVLNNPNHRLRKGMTADVKFVVENNKDSLVVPEEAIYRSAGTKYIFLIKNGKTVKREVQLGIRSNSQVEIISNIASESVVAITNLNQLNNGSEVYIWNSEEVKQ